MKKISLLLISLFVFLSLSDVARGQSLQDYLEQGMKKYNNSDFRGVLKVWGQGLVLAKKMNSKKAIGIFLGGIGMVYCNLGEYAKALSYCEQALKIGEEIGEKMMVKDNLTNIGAVFDNLGDNAKALTYYRQALNIAKEIGDKKGIGDNLTNIGIVYYNLGEHPKALNNFEQALKIKKEIGDKKGIGDNLTNIGIVHWKLGEYAKALSNHEEGLKIHKEIGDKKGIGYNLTNIGAVFIDLGDYTKALNNIKQALDIGKEIGDKKGIGADLHNIGVIYWNLEEYAKALSNFEQALNIFKEIEVPTKITELSIGIIYLDQGRLDNAFEIFKRIKDPVCLGRYYLALKEYKKAQMEFLRSHNLLKVMEMPNAEIILADYIGLGLAREGLMDYAQARGYFQKGIDLIEKQRASLGGAERERFFEAKVMGFPRMEPYEGMIRVLNKEKGEGYEKEALAFAERAKSRIFLEQLANRNLGGRGKEDRNALEKEKKIQQELLVLKKRFEVMESLGEKAPKGELPRLKKEFEAKEAELERFIKEVKLKNTELASLISVSPTPIEQIQKLLDANTSMIEYYTTQDKVYTWLLTRNTIKVYEIPLKEKDLQNKVEAFRLLNISNKSRRPQPKITYGVGEEYKKETSDMEREADRQKFSQEAQAFYETIFAPLEKDIQTDKLIIVPHGVLHKIPFAALSDGRNYLIDKYALSVLPSAGVMEYVVKKRKPFKQSILTLANPLTDYLPLEFAEVEGEGVSKHFPKRNVYMNEKATETLAKKRAAEFNVIHFASHGEFNDRQPMQSGLILARDNENDGYLQVHEIFSLDLKNANLVTLSACETALSKIQGGDDLVGLSRGFIYAGTPSLLATLWKVFDPSTAELMEKFYDNWKNKGMSKPEALRQAQLALKAIPGYEHPYYWAPFVMIGDWK